MIRSVCCITQLRYISMEIISAQISPFDFNWHFTFQTNKVSCLSVHISLPQAWILRSRHYTYTVKWFAQSCYGYENVICQTLLWLRFLQSIWWDNPYYATLINYIYVSCPCWNKDDVYSETSKWGFCWLYNLGSVPSFKPPFTFTMNRLLQRLRGGIS